MFGGFRWVGFSRAMRAGVVPTLVLGVGGSLYYSRGASPLPLQAVAPDRDIFEAETAAAFADHGAEGADAAAGTLLEQSLAAHQDTAIPHAMTMRAGARELGRDFDVSQLARSYLLSKFNALQRPLWFRGSSAYAVVTDSEFAIGDRLGIWTVLNRTETEILLGDQGNLGRLWFRVRDAAGANGDSQQPPGAGQLELDYGSLYLTHSAVMRAYLRLTSFSDDLTHRVQLKGAFHEARRHAAASQQQSPSGP